MVLKGFLDARGPCLKFAPIKEAAPIADAISGVAFFTQRSVLVTRVNRRLPKAQNGSKTKRLRRNQAPTKQLPIGQVDVLLRMLLQVAEQDRNAVVSSVCPRMTLLQ
eukprot:5436084-Amphidinium_carterae.1